MEDMENLVTEEAAENGEQTTEQTPKLYTEAEMNAKVDELLGRKIARKEAKIRKEYERRYGGLAEMRKAGTGNEGAEETDTRQNFYASRGVQSPERMELSARDIEVLAKADADKFISAGLEEVVEETDRLAALGVGKMTDREKAVFKNLAEHRQKAERARELSKLGVTEDVYNSREFQDFAGKFHSNTPITDIYDIYSKTQPRKTVRTMGSMKNSTSDEAAVKDFYTREEALKFSKKDFDRNPALFQAVEASMLKW